LILANTGVARDYIRRLCTVVRSQQKTVKMFKEAAENSDRLAIVANENIIKEKANSKVNENLRQYYMHLLLKFIRNIDLLQGHD
jgi:hypothetical protein